MSQTSLPSFNCPACHSDRIISTVILQAYKAFKPLNDKAYELKKCACCKHEFVASMPSDNELTLIYDESFYKNYMSGMGYEAAFAQVLKSDFEKKITLVSNLLSRGSSILEVGCGPGYFSRMLKDASYNVTSLELSEEAIIMGRRVGVEIHKFLLGDPETPIHGKQFDAVISWATVEHIPNAAHFIDLMSRHVKPGGYLLLDTVNANAFLGKIEGGLNSWYCPPYHLHYYSSQSLLHMVPDDLKLVWLCRHFNLYDTAVKYPLRILKNILRLTWGRFKSPISPTSYGSYGSILFGIWRKEIQG